MLLKELPWQHPLANLDGASAAGNSDAADAADARDSLFEHAETGGYPVEV